jgi:HK97 family phage portal protein
MRQKITRFLGIPIISHTEKNTLSEKGEERSNVSNPSQSFLTAIGADKSSAGVTLGPYESITISAVYRAVSVISNSLAFLPFNLYRKNKDGGSYIHTDHYLNKLLINPSQQYSEFIFKQLLQVTKLLWGNAYAYIRRSEGIETELVYLHPSTVRPELTITGMVYHVSADYVYNIPTLVPAKDMIHLPGLGFDGIEGKSVIQVQRESLGLTKAAEIFGAKFFGSGANMSGVLQVPGKLTEPAYENLKNSWNNKYSGLGNSHETPILEGGTTYNRIGIPPEDAQFLQTRKFQIEEISRWFGVQPHLLMHLERSTNNNIEHQGMEFVRYTLAPEIAVWESEFNRKLVQSSKQGKLFCEYDMNALLRGDSKTRAEYYQKMFSVAAMTSNQIRNKESQSSYEGGDRYFVQAGYAPVDLIDTVYKNDPTHAKQETHNTDNNGEGN